MSEALINRLERDEAREPVPNEGLQHAQAGVVEFTKNLRRLSFSISWVPQTTQSLRLG
jgi:hypothetical protein